VAAHIGHIKLGGRKKGTENKVTGKVREVFTQIVEQYIISDFQKDLIQLTPEQRIKVMINLSEFIIPKMQRIEGEITQPENSTKIIVIRSPNDYQGLPQSEKEIEDL
jgi:hypothetical protein